MGIARLNVAVAAISWLASALALAAGSWSPSNLLFTSGVAFAILVRWGWQTAPGLLIGVALLPFISETSLVVQFSISVSQFAGIALAGGLVRHGERKRLQFDRLADVQLFLVALTLGSSLPALVCPFLLSSLRGLELDDYARAILSCGCKNALGMLIVAPLLLLPKSLEVSGPIRIGARLAWPAIGVCAALAIVSPFFTGSPHFQTLLICFPLVVLAAVRFGPRGAVLANLFCAIAWFSPGDLSAAEEDAASESIAFIIVMAVMGLYLGAIVAEWATALGGLAADIAARVIADGDRRVVDAERLLLKESLSADRARLAALLECSHDAIVIMSPDGLMAYVSDAITRLTGRDRAGLLGKSILEHVHPDDISLARLSFADCLAHPTLPTKAEFRLITAAGHWVWLEALATNHLSNTVIAGVLINFRDVTERRAAERRLEEARTLLEATGRIAQIGGWEYIVPEDRLVWSEQTYRIHDLDRMTIKPTIAEALEFYEPSARPIIRDALDQGLKKGQDWNLVLPLISASGRRLWVNAIGQVETRAGQPYRLYGTIQDVTARIEANRAIERSESRYKNLFETAPVAIWEEDFSAIANWFNELRDNKIIDLGSYLKNHPETIAAAIRIIKVRDVNQAAVTMNRASDKADLIANMQRLFTADSQGLFAAELVSFWNGERTLRLESRSVRLSGEPADVVLHLRVPEVDGQPDFSRVVVIALDVTEQKSLEDQLRQAQKLEAIGRLAGGVAHDFNNLLTVINGFAELILADAPAKSGIRDLAGHIRDAGRRAATLTRQLLAFSRKQPPTAKLVDVAAVVAGIRPLLSTLAGDDVRLVTQLDPVLPVKVDRAQLESAIMNLAVNARDAMPQGGTLTVSASLKIDPRNPPPDCPPTRWVMLSVSDTGTGIPEEVRKHLFEPFFTTKEVGKGTGLGLSTVYGIVTTAGGSIRYETAVGAGTTFHIYLPATEAEWESDLPTTEAAVAMPAVEFEKTSPARLQTRPVVLLVEDQTDVRALSVRVLESAGYPVIEAESGPMALAKLAKVPVGPFVLVTDILMPRMNGRELASQVRAIRPDVAVLLMSGYAPENILANETLVDEGFLAKPFSPEELLHAVSTLALAIAR